MLRVDEHNGTRPAHLDAIRLFGRLTGTQEGRQLLRDAGYTARTPIIPVFPDERVEDLVAKAVEIGPPAFFMINDQECNIPDILVLRPAVSESHDAQYVGHGSSVGMLQELIRLTREHCVTFRLGTWNHLYRAHDHQLQLS